MWMMSQFFSQMMNTSFLPSGRFSMGKNVYIIQAVYLKPLKFHSSFIQLKKVFTGGAQKCLSSMLGMLVGALDSTKSSMNGATKM